MKKKFPRLLIIALALIMSSTAIAETVPIPKPANEPGHTFEGQTRWLANEGVIKLFEGKKVLTGMTIQPNALEIVLNESFSWDMNIFSQPSRLEINIYNAVNGLGADSIDINKIGIAKVLFVNAGNFLKFVLFPTDGTPLPSLVEVIDNSRGLMIHMADLPKEPHPVPAIGKLAIPVDSAPPTGTVMPSTLTAKSTAPPISVNTKTLPGIVAPVAKPIANSSVYYSLIAGESVNRKKLDSVAEKLRAFGYKPDVTDAMREVAVFRLKVACFAERKPAELRRAQVANRSRKAFIVRNVDSYCVFAGSLMSEESARKEQKRLAAKGVEGLQIVRARVLLKIWRLTTERNIDGLEAVKSIQALAKRGIEVKIVETGD